MSVSRVSNATAATAVAGLHMVTPTSVTVGSGTGSVSGQGAVTFSGATSVILDNCFNSNYENYKVLLNVVTSGTSQDIYVQLTDGASYYQSKWQHYFGSSAVTANSSAQTYWNAGRTSIYGGSLVVDIFSPNKSVRTFMNSQSSDADKFGSVTGGFTDDFNQHTRFRILGSSNGAFTGTIRVYGYNNGGA